MQNFPRAYPFRAVLFDMDGVLIHTTEMHYRAWETFAKTWSLSPSRLLATNGRRAEETLRDWFSDELTLGELAAMRLEGLVRETFATAPLSPIPGIHRFLLSPGCPAPGYPHLAGGELPRPALLRARLTQVPTQGTGRRGLPPPAATGG